MEYVFSMKKVCNGSFTHFEQRKSNKIRKLKVIVKAPLSLTTAK